MSSYLFTELLLHWATFSLTERPLCWGTSSLSYFFSELLHICSELRSSPATSSLSYFSSSVCNPILLFARVRFRVHIFFLKLSNLFLSQNRSIVCFIWFCFIIIIMIMIIIIINVSRWYQFLCAAMTIQFCSLQLQSGMATYNLFSNLQLQSRMAGASQRWQCRRFRTGRARRAPNFFFACFPEIELSLQSGPLFVDSFSRSRPATVETLLGCCCTQPFPPANCYRCGWRDDKTDHGHASVTRKFVN